MFQAYFSSGLLLLIVMLFILPEIKQLFSPRHSLSVARQMTARASTAVACRAYRTKKVPDRI